MPKPQPQPVEQDRSKLIRIHYLVPDPRGPIPSASGGSPAIVPSSAPQWRAACDHDGKVVMGDFDRGTGETWGVRCAACKRTEIFKKNYRSRPSAVPDATETGDEAPELVPGPLAAPDASMGIKADEGCRT